MSLRSEEQAIISGLPQALRALLEAELAAGNRIAEVGHSHPAPPAGATFLLARPVTTRARASGNGLNFYDRNGSTHSGEFTDDQRFFFILEPPRPPEPTPDMDAIRAGIEARQREADERRRAEIEREPLTERHSEAPPQASRPTAASARADTDRIARFRASMDIDYERWRDGTGYDLALLRSASTQELQEIEGILLSRGVRDWRDVEALAALDSPRTRDRLRQTLLGRDPALAHAVTLHAPGLVDETERIAVLVRALEETDFYGGLTQALAQVESFHPPAVIEALLKGVLQREGAVAVHFAAVLLYLHGKAASPFDENQRPYLLRFNTPSRGEREDLFRNLCSRIGVEPDRILFPRALGDSMPDRFIPNP